MTREEHLAWAKERALEYVERGELQNAVASMVSDFGKHEAWANSSFVGPVGLIGAMFEVPRGPEAVRRWINGFN